MLQEVEEEKKDNSGEGYPTKAHLRFAISNDPLFKYEDTRADSKANEYNSVMSKAEYIVELDLINIKSLVLFIEKNPVIVKQDKGLVSRQVNLKMYIAVHKPCGVQKIYPQREQKPQDVRSPFRHPDDNFLNYWNLHQVYHVGGKSY